VLTTSLRIKHILRMTHKLRCFIWRQNNPVVNYSFTRISGGGGGVFLEKVSLSRERNRDILLGTWNVMSLYKDEPSGSWRGSLGLDGVDSG